MKIISKISIFIIVIVVIFIAFTKHFLLGLLAIFAYLAYVIFSKRNMIYTSLANAAHHKGDHQKSFLWLDKAYQIDPTHHQIAITYGYNLLKYDDLALAEQILERLASTSTAPAQRSALYMNIALVRWKQNRLDEAITILEEIHEHMKTSVLYGSLGCFYIEKGDLEQALAFNLEAYAFNDSNTVILDNLGMTYILLNQWDKAEEIYIQLMLLKPAFPEAYYHQGLVQANRGELELAYANFVEALKQPFTNLSTEPKEIIELKKAELQEKLQIPDDNKLEEPEEN